MVSEMTDSLILYNETFPVASAQVTSSSSSAAYSSSTQQQSESQTFQQHQLQVSERDVLG